MNDSITENLLKYWGESSTTEETYCHLIFNEKKIQNKYLTFSFCNPSRGPTSTTFTKLGRPATCKHQNQNLVKSNSEKNKIIRRTQQEENNAWNDKRVEHEGPFLECPWCPKFIHSPGISGIDKYYFFFLEGK